MTKTMTECPYCKRPADECGAINHVGGCTGLQDIRMNRLQYDILRGNLSLAEEGLASYALEVERLRGALTGLQPLHHMLDRQRAVPDAVPDWISLAIEEAAFIIEATLAGKPAHPNQTAVQTLEHIEKLRLAAEPLHVGTSVTYVPRHALQLPRDGWTIDRLPPEPTYIIRHAEGSVIAVSAHEIQPALRTNEQ